MKASARRLVVLLAPLLAVQPTGLASAATRAAPQGATTGSISGTVTAATGGAGLGDVFVEILKPNGSFVTSAFTANDGTYLATGIPASSNNIVCFDASNAIGGSSTTGYADQCWQNVPWDGNFIPPAT